MTGERYRRIVFGATVLLALIVFTGAAVRLTDSGLGCEDWPTCNDEQLVPEASFHGWVEFGNRLLSGVVGVSVGLAVLKAYRREPRRPDLIRWAWGLVGGVVAQILLGAVTVMADLHPVIVSFHFLLSAVLLWNALVLLAKADSGSAIAVPTVTKPTLDHSRLLFVLAGVVLVIGTLVTGTGPNSGDPRADRLGFDFDWIARSHSFSAWIFLAALVAFALRFRSGLAPASQRPLTVLLLATVVQGGIGYWQYLTSVPPLLVEFHVMGAVTVWMATVWLHLSLSDRSGTTAEPRSSGRDTAAVAHSA